MADKYIFLPYKVDTGTSAENEFRGQQIGTDAPIGQMYKGGNLAPDKNAESTSAPPINPNPQEGKSLAQNQWALADKLIFSTKFIPFPLIIIVIGLILIQDNKSGNLKDWSDLLWSIQKCGAILIVYFIIFAIQWIINKLFRQNS